MFVGSMVGEVLARLQVSYVFGVIGGSNFLPIQSLHGAGCTFVPARHQSGAVSMAIGYARAADRLGLCTVHYGPAVVNALTGIGEAVHSRTPLLVIAGSAQGPDAQRPDTEEQLLRIWSMIPTDFLGRQLI